MNQLEAELENSGKEQAAKLLHSDSRVPEMCAGCVGGFFPGAVSAWFLWNFFYSIGSRVISDEIYASLESKVVLLGGCGSALLGLSCSLFPPRIALKWFATGQIGALFLGCAGGHLSWTKGVSAYFGSIGILALTLCFWHLAGWMTKWLARE